MSQLYRLLAARLDEAPRGYMFTVDGTKITVHLDQDDRAHVARAIEDFERATAQLRALLSGK